MKPDLLKSAFDGLCRVSAGLKRLLWRRWYDYLAEIDRDADLLFMNYGFSDAEPHESVLPLLDAEERYRYCIQLYHRACRTVDLAGKEVLEVGCGRGGGTAYLASRFGPAAIKGVDFSRKAIEFCRRYHAGIPSASFVHADAEALPFDAHSFDAVVNVESSHSYGSVRRFLGEVHRVLRPRGLFLLADFRDAAELPFLRRQLGDAGFGLLREEDITAGVLKALDRDDGRKTELIRKKVPSSLVRPFRAFAATRGSTTYDSFRNGETVYFSYIAQKG